MEHHKSLEVQKKLYHT